MRPEILFPLFRSISNIKGIGSKSEKLISKLCGDKIIDLIWHLPSNIVDRSYSPQLINAKIGSIATIEVEILEHIKPSSRKSPYKVICTDGTDKLTISFFKAHKDYIIKELPVGEKRVISGKLERYNNQWQMNHPDYIGKDIKEIAGIEAIYPLTHGISNKTLSKHIKTALNELPELNEWLDIRHKEAQKWLNWKENILKAHNPKSMFDIDASSSVRERLAYDELLANQLALAIVRQQVKKHKGIKIDGDGHLRSKLKDNLSFELTGAQKRVLQEINQDMASDYRMHRLLQGDVGSGKTIVALFAMLNAVETGHQATIMAPTEILAKQHFETVKELCENIDVRIELLTGRNKGKARTLLLEELKDGKIDILIGTHALFQSDVEYKNLACVIIDEQHRFGVHQRLALSEKGKNCDILVMTATPIPRTLVLTAYGDMEYSKIDEVPKGRKPTDTRVMPLNKIVNIISGLERKIKEGHRAYWVCPLVEEFEKLDLAAAMERYEHLKRIFGNKVGLVHGKLKAKEKDEVMEKFSKGEISILVSTTVIEVGVNVPEATIMIIEHAERFGLAQLHQLRGRVKRGFEASNCILLYNYPLSENSRSRLNIMKETEDGFLIAEEDLRLRGGGEVLGTKQTGFDNFKFADITTNKDFLITASKDAKMILEMDPKLETIRGKALRELLYLFQQDENIKTYLAG